MEISSSGLDVKKLIMVPALIALVITIVRLVGELGAGPSALFNRDPGGGGALIGIVWLIPIFGVYFAVKLVRGGFGPESAGKVMGFAGLGLVAAVAIASPVFFQTMLSYAFASRIPVLIVMFIAMLGNWGTHYELGPPGYPEMGFLAKFIVIGLLNDLLGHGYHGFREPVWWHCRCFAGIQGQWWGCGSNQLILPSEPASDRV